MSISYSNEVEAFVENAKNYWENIKNGASRQANKCEAANKKIIKNFASSADAEFALNTLLTHDSKAVRLSAAAHLLNFPNNESAISTLVEFRDNDPGLMAVSAKMILEVSGFSS